MTNPLSKLCQHVAAREDERLESSVPREQTRRFLAEYVAERGARRRGAGGLARRPGIWLSLAALLTAVGLVLSRSPVEGPPLSFHVGAGQKPGVLRALEVAPSDARLPIEFSDGTRLELEPGARARVVELGREGGEVVLEAGRAHVSVVPQARRSGVEPWRVRTGPYLVEVKGTRFELAWDPQADAFALDLFEGRVVVGGCEPGQSHTLVAGQSARASCGEKRWVVSSLAAASALEVAPAREAPSEAVTSLPGDASVSASDAEAEAKERDAHERAAEGAERVAPSSERAARRPAPKVAAPAPSWQALAREGHFEAAYRRIVEAGLDTRHERLPAADLLLLGDTARLNADVAVARSAYLTVRRRFAQSAEAARAAFALGRIEVEADPSGAARWFELYLREQPRGSLVAAARDRLFELAAAAGDEQRQRRAAREYLEHQPAGAHAADARKLLALPEAR